MNESLKKMFESGELVNNTSTAAPCAYTLATFPMNRKFNMDEIGTNLHFHREQFITKPINI